MWSIRLSDTQRMCIVIGIGVSFFVAEIVVGFYTRSLAVIADAFHYLNDIVGQIVALVAIRISLGKAPPAFPFGWARARLLGSFFNGVLLAGLGLSIFLQALERFVNATKVEQPKLVLIIGATGFALNIASGALLHQHSHGHGHSLNVATPVETAHVPLTVLGLGVHDNHGHTRRVFAERGSNRDLGIYGVFLHVVGDAINNVGVMVSAIAIWRGKTEGRFYADPAISMAISLIILATSIPLIKNSGMILLQSTPGGVEVAEVQMDLETLPGISSVHDLYIWRLNQEQTIASAHLRTSSDSLENFMKTARHVGECLKAYGVHSYTLQPELVVDRGYITGQALIAGEAPVHVDDTDARCSLR